MSKEEIRKEEDFAKSKGLALCDICAKRQTSSCRLCSHFYGDLFEVDRVMQKIREVVYGKQD